MDLPVIVNLDDSDDGPAIPVAGEQHHAWADPVRLASVAKHRPAYALVVLGIQVGDYVVVHTGSRRAWPRVLMVGVVPSLVLTQ